MKENSARLVVGAQDVDEVLDVFGGSAVHAAGGAAVGGKGWSESHHKTSSPWPPSLSLRCSHRWRGGCEESRGSSILQAKGASRPHLDRGHHRLCLLQCRRRRQHHC